MKTGIRLFLLLAGILLLSLPGTEYVRAEPAGGNEDPAYTEPDKEQEANELKQEILSELDLKEVQDMLDAMLGEESFSFQEALENLLTGKDAFSEEAVQKILHGLLFSGLEKEKSLFMKILLLILLAALLANFASVFDSGQIGEISFYIVYLLLFMLLMNSFSQAASALQQVISWMTDFMKALAPAYLITVSAASGAGAAAMFYEGVLILVWLIQWILLSVILPGTDLYVLLRLVNHLSREEMLGKLAELLSTAISWGLKTLLGIVAGLQVVKGLVAPVVDTLKRSLIGKAAGALPGVGNAVNMVTELVVTSAVLVRNCLGVMILIAFVLAGAGPVIRYGILSLAYRFLAACAQPVSDKRIVECLSTVGEGYGLLLKILFTAEVLCMLAFLILMAGLGGGA
ncbi:MAG: stage III sporulation protein AE [Blautia sp.]